MIKRNDGGSLMCGTYCNGSFFYHNSKATTEFNEKKQPFALKVKLILSWQVELFSVAPVPEFDTRSHGAAGEDDALPRLPRQNYYCIGFLLNERWPL